MSAAEEIDWNLISYITRSTYRTLFLKQLRDGPATPTDLQDETGIHITHVSRSLTRLKERGVVDYESPAGKGPARYYELTDRGEAIIEQVGEVDR